MEDPYRILNLPPGSAWPQVEASFRHLAEIHHPKNGGDQRHFSQLLQAYEQIRQNTKKSTTPLPPPSPHNPQPPSHQIPPSKTSTTTKSNPYLTPRVTASVFAGITVLAASRVAEQTIPLWIFGIALFATISIFFAFPTIVLYLFRPNGRILVAVASLSLILSPLLPATLLLVAILIYFMVETLRVFPLGR